MASVVRRTTFALPCYLLLLLFFVLQSDAHPIKIADKCKSGCRGDSTTFKYADGTTYKYNLESNVDISLSTAEGQQSATKLKATVLLSQQADCVQVIRLQNVQVFGSDGKKRAGIPNLDKPIKINFHDGHIEDVICAEDGDTQVSLNIKRAVASLFQAAQHDREETDVFGDCPTSFSTHKDGNQVTISKNRILNRCAHRENVKHDFISTAFNTDSEIRSSPILKSDYNAEMRVKDGILDHVLVTENYLYLPFSVGKNGAKAIVQTKLQLAGKSKDAVKEKCGDPKSIIFENPHPIASEKSDVKTILDAVKDTANSIKETVSAHTASKFSNLINVIAQGKKDHLLSVYNQVQSGAGFADKEKGKKVFLDALFRAGTGDCLEVSIQLLKSKQLSPLEERLVYLGMSFVRHATPESIATASTLLDTPKLPREAYLGIGALTARYCQQHDCKDVEQIKLLSGKLLAKLKDGKPANRDVENEMIAVLKSLANMKHLADSVVPKIIAIAQDKKSTMRLRVAALEAYQSDACKDKLRDSAIAILKDIQQDAEIRIKAYLALAQCPNAKVSNAVKSVLDNEPSYQVGGFIVSHIRNLRASANVDKELAKDQLGNINTMKKFPVDPRKYSFNNEFSYAFDTLGTSSSVESNIIYSQNSFLPRSTSLNLTTEVFGHKVNLLQIESRQENLDKLMEHYLGPLGVLRKDPDEAFKTGKASADKVAEQVKERFEKTRGKRHVPKSEIDAVSKAVQIKTNELNNDLDLDVSIKLFGSEFLFLSLNDNMELYSTEKIIDKIFDTLDNAIDKAKNFQHTFTRNGVFIDAELAYPTASGFPLKISVEGTDSVQLIAESKTDVRALLNWDKDAFLQLKLIPSANLEISGRLTLDASVLESGLKVTSNLHTATGGALVIEAFSSGIDAKFNLPIEKQEIINVQHEIVFVTRETGHSEVEQPLKFVETKPLDVCLDQVSEIIGLTACAVLNAPNQQLNQGVFLPYPLNGNSELRVYLTRDEAVTYHLRSSHNYDDNKKGFEFTIETLGADKKPKVSLNVEGYVHPEKYIRASLDSPIKKAIAEARFTDTDKEKSLGAKFVHDMQEWSGKVGVDISGNEARSVYKPLIEFTTPDQGKQSSPYTIEGAIIAEHSGDNSKYTFENVLLKSPTRKPFAITGKLGKENGAYFSDVKLDDGAEWIEVKGNVEGTAKYIKLDGKVMTSMAPASNFHIKYELSQDADSLINDLTLIHGGDFSKKENTLKLRNKVVRRYTDESNYQYTTENVFSYPLIGLEGKFNLNKVPKTIECETLAKYEKAKLATKLSAKYNQKEDGDYDVNFDAEIIDNKLKAKAKREINGDMSTIDHSLDLNGKKAEVKGTITHKCKPNDRNIGCDLTIQVPQCPDPITLKHGYIETANEVKSHLKLNKGSENIVDFDLNLHDTQGGNGHIKANIKDVVVVDGELKAQDWNGKAHLIVDLVKIQRKLKVDSTFELAEPKYNIAVNFYPNFEKSQDKISLVSNNVITDEDIDSKNVLTVLDQTFEGNLKVSATGDVLNGKINIDSDLTLPNGHYFVGKVNREMTTVNGVSNGNGFLNLEHRENKNTPGKKLTLKGVVKDTNLEEEHIDVSHSLTIDGGNGKNYNGDFALKYHDDDTKTSVDISGKVYGSELSTPVEYQFKCTATEDDGNFEWTSKGPHHTMNFNGKLDGGEDNKPVTGDVNLDLTTTIPQLKTFKFSAAGKALADDNKFELGGSTKLFIDDDGTNPDATVDIQADADINLGENAGQIKATTKIQKLDPISLACGYGHQKENGLTKCQGDASLKYAADKNIKADVTFIRPNDKEGKLELKLETPFEVAKTSQFEINYKLSEDNETGTSHVIATVDGKKYEAKSEIKLSSTEPLINVQLTHDDHTDKFYMKAAKPSSHVYNGEMKIVHRDFTYDLNYEYNIPSVDDFSIHYKVHCPTMNVKDVDLSIKNNKNKLIEIEATSAGENLIKGAMSYKAHEEGSKYIVEGSGELAIRNEKKTGNFKFMKHMMTMEKNQEQGAEVTLDANIGDLAIDSEYKLTNKHFRVLSSVCKKKNDCEHFEIDAKSNIKDIAEYDHELEINLEVPAFSFGTKAVTKRKNLQFDHTTDVHFQTKDNQKYQYSLYIHPKKAGVSLITPKRQVALESQTEIPPKFKGPFKFQVNFYLDKKNEPTKVTTIAGSLEYTGDEKIGKLVGDAKLSSPGLAKDMVVSYTETYDIPKKSGDAQLVLDIFAKQNNKIVITSKAQLTHDDEAGKYALEGHSTIKSPGLGIDITYDEIPYQYDSTTHSFKSMVKLTVNSDNHKCTCLTLLELSPSKAHVKLQLHNKELLEIAAKLKLTKENQMIDSDVKVFGFKPLQSHYELKDYNTMKYTLASKENPANKLTVNAALIPGQVADFRVDISNNELMKASLKLDETNFLKPDYGFNYDNVQKLLLEPARNEIDNAAKETKTLLADTEAGAKSNLKHFSELAKKNAPNLKGVKEYYANEWQKISNDISTDAQIQKASELLHKLFGTIGKITSEVVSKFVELLEETGNAVKNIVNKLAGAMDSSILPQLRATLESLFNLTHNIISSCTDIISSIIGQVGAFMEAHKGEFKELGASLSQMTQDFGRYFSKTYKRVEHFISSSWTKLYEELKALPIIDDLKARVDLLLKDTGDFTEPLKHIIEDALNTVKDIVPNDDVKKIIEAVRDYVGKKMKGEPVDDTVAIENILKHLLALAKKVISQFKAQDLQLIDPDVLSVNYASALPRVGLARLSPLNYLLQGEGPWWSYKETLYGVTFNPRSLIGPPFRLYGYLIQGQHIMTFDGKHVHFPGACNYLIVRDAVNGNFTVGGTYANGILTALTYADGTESVTIKKGGQIMHNKAAAEFPLRVGQVNAFRTYSRLHVHSKAGVEITCDANLIVCKISVSGFYHGQLRGLLGNGNNEPYDDMTMPNGKIVMSESDFGNAYKMTASCKPIPAVEHTHGHAPGCTELFTDADTLEVCYPFVNPEMYRSACDHGVSAGVKDTEEALANAYVTACNAKFIPAILPQKYLTCTNGDEKRKLWEKFSVKLPGKAADIVIIVDQAKSNEVIYKELVQPFVTELTKELSTKGVTDVEFHVIGYGGEHQNWPTHYTNGGKLSWKGKLPAMKFGDAPKQDLIAIEHQAISAFFEQLERAIVDVGLVLGANMRALTFMEGYMYPFRAHATKSLIAFNTSPCEQGRLLSKLRAKLFFDEEVQISLVTPFKEFKVVDAKTSKSVVGFDNKHVWTFADAKKKGAAGNTELYKDLSYDDYCSEIISQRNGAVFNMDNFVAAKGPQRQQFAQIVSQAIAHQITGTEQRLDCECSLRGSTVARNVCDSVSTKDSKGTTTKRR